MITFILGIFYKNGLLKKSKAGKYYCDPSNSCRVTFRYIPLLGKSASNIKNYCGNWHRIRLFKWEIDYLIIKKIKVKNKISFP